MTYERTDHFSCGHTYSMDRHGRSLKVEKCPICNTGDYEYSVVMTDDKSERSFAEMEASRVSASAEGTPTLIPSPASIEDIGAWREILASYRASALGIDISPRPRRGRS